MKYHYPIICALALMLATGSVIADKGGREITGYWTGNGMAMYVDGTTAEITSVEADLIQDGQFIYGIASFDVLVGDATEPETQQGQISAYLDGKTIKGVLGGCITEAPDCVGAGTFEGSLRGGTMRGVVVDLSDGSTSVVEMVRVDPE